MTPPQRMKLRAKTKMSCLKMRWQDPGGVAADVIAILAITISLILLSLPIIFFYIPQVSS